MEQSGTKNSLLIFLVLECLAICAFGLGNISYIFFALGILVSGASIVFCYKRFSKSEIKSLLTFCVPMFVLSIFVSFGKLLGGSVLENVLLFLAINLFLFMGIVARRFNGFDINIVLIVTGFAIGLLVLISMVYTWTQYGFFYTLIYRKTPIYYYNAELFDITKEAGWLVGFKFLDTKINYTSTFALILMCYLLALPFTSPKENKRYFYMYLGIGLIGVIYLLTLPNFKALLFLIPAIGIALCYKFLKDNKKFHRIFDYVMIGISITLIIFFVIALFNASDTAISSTIESSRLLNRLFNSNRIMMNVNPILQQSAMTYNLFGFVPELIEGKMNFLQFEEVEDAVLTNSKMFEIELIKDGGLFTVILIVLVIIVAYVFVKKYLLESDDKDYNKVVLVSILATFFVYLTFENEVFPLVHESSHYYAFFRNPLTLVMLALLGMTFPCMRKDEPVSESTSKEITPEDRSYEI